MCGINPILPKCGVEYNGREKYNGLVNGKIPKRKMYGYHLKVDLEAEDSVYWALRNGYCLIDTARIYGNETGIICSIMALSWNRESDVRVREKTALGKFFDKETRPEQVPASGTGIGGIEMDLNETTREVMNRHPWELSRTHCVLESFSRYLERSHRENGAGTYINAGAGDLYFDRALLEKYELDQVYAVDIAYKDMTADDSRVHKYHFLEEIQAKKVDYAIMMDSLEYMEDDAEYIRNMGKKIKKGASCIIQV